MNENGFDNRTLRDFLQETVPDYIGNVPPHWLESHILSPEIQTAELSHFILKRIDMPFHIPVINIIIHKIWLHFFYKLLSVVKQY